jgi:hypothetical protein
MWQGHAKNTARVLNTINPDYIRSRPFYPAPGSPLFEAYNKGEFQLLTPREQLIELKLMMEELHAASRVCFDHAANCWIGPDGGLLFSQSYEGYRFPDEKPMVLQLIEEGIRVQKDTPGSEEIRPFL